MKREVIIVDDDSDLCNIEKISLEKEGYLVCKFSTGNEFLKDAHQVITQSTVIVLDLMLPDMNGFEVLCELRKTHNTPVLILTAMDSEIDRVSGFRLGADDYLIKPYFRSEFLERIKALHRRSSPLFDGSPGLQKKHGDIIFSDMMISKSKHVVMVDDIEISLTSKEFDIYCFLANNPGCVFTKQQIYENVWGNKFYYDDNIILVQIQRLRKALKKGSLEDTIVTIWGVGYMFREKQS